MPGKNLSYYARVMLIAAEIVLISVLSYAAGAYLPGEMGAYISLDVLYCLPIIQTARLAAIHDAVRNSDTQISTVIGIAVALAWSITEAVIIWPDFPMAASLLNLFTRSVAFTVLGRVVLKLWRKSEYAHKDMVTGLANRMELLEKLEIEQARSERSGRAYSLLYLDIDRFKSLNDGYGHHVGDDALKLVAGILQASSREADVAARVGGDEFVLLLPDTDAGASCVLIERIGQATKQAFAARSWDISVSIGQATKTGRTKKPDWVIQVADEDMYETKRAKQQAVNGASGELFL